ncbi:hypothetical protein C1H46_037649 [Malus baccata]|uniref:MGS-like domain-containing protein n=1 Tax=Malus baccata TaxID=106549 RepID=A0A540KRG1_MALBA|nr:hypothetical protein C1H46_037649 [Malus baccata]
MAAAGETLTVTNPDSQSPRPVSGNRQALILLSDKKDLAVLGNGLQNLGYKIVSTGGTASALKKCWTFDGRVKTLHPNVHGGILARRDQTHHMEALSKHGIGTFDVVGVNLYPFYDKNHKDVLVVVDSEDYPALLEFLKGDKDDQQFRRKLARKAFQHVASYDSAVSEWLWKQTSEEVRWIDDGFRGLLPFPFNSTLGGTAAAPPYLNNKNKASDSQYLRDLDQCTFLVELQLSRPFPSRGSDLSTWEVIGALPYLDRELSPAKYRSFFIPYLWQHKNIFGMYKLLRRHDFSKVLTRLLFGGKKKEK